MLSFLFFYEIRLFLFRATRISKVCLASRSNFGHLLIRFYCRCFQWKWCETLYYSRILANSNFASLILSLRSFCSLRSFYSFCSSWFEVLFKLIEFSRQKYFKILIASYSRVDQMQKVSNVKVGLLQKQNFAIFIGKNLWLEVGKCLICLVLTSDQWKLVITSDP